jgi:hypothetical protein
MKKILLLLIALFLSLAINAQDSDKTVTLTVSGTGNTLEEAKNNALRSAIEQAFGAYISSKTEILNDNLVKDEIVSVANGNIQKFDIISENEIPNVGYNCLLSAVVSISKLTSFIESKGGDTELKGSVLAYNLKIKNLAKESEFLAMNKISETLRNYLSQCFDYEISLISDPKVISDNSVSISLKMNAKFNNNIELFKKLFLESLRGISIDLNNVKEYKSLNIPTYNLFIGPIIEKTIKKNGKIKEVEDGKLFVLRNKKTYDEVLSLFNLYPFAKNFVINNGVSSIDGNLLFDLPTRSYEINKNYKYGEKEISTSNYNELIIKKNAIKINNYIGSNVFYNPSEKHRFEVCSLCNNTSGLYVKDDVYKSLEHVKTQLEKYWVSYLYWNNYRDDKGFLIDTNESLYPTLIQIGNLNSNNESFSIEFEHLISNEDLSKISKYLIYRKE